MLTYGLIVILIYLLACDISDRKAESKHDKKIEQYRKNVGCYLM